jgi:anti-sigma factor RsiW
MTDPHLDDDRLLGYVLDELPPDARAEVETHLDRCDSCSGRISSLAQILDGYRRAPDPEAPARILVELLGRQSAFRPGRGSSWTLLRPRTAIAAFAFVALLFLAGFWTGRSSAPQAPPTGDRSEQPVVRQPLPDPPRIPFETAPPTEPIVEFAEKAGSGGLRLHRAQSGMRDSL